MLSDLGDGAGQGDAVFALQGLQQAGAAQGFGIQAFGGQKEDAEVGGVRRLQVFVGHAARFLPQARLQRAGGGQIGRMGRTDAGNTVSDFQTEEQKRQISIGASLLTMERGGKTLFALDAPGFADFAGEMSAAIRVSDASLLLVSAVGGVEVQTGRAWEYALDNHKPVVFCISKMVPFPVLKFHHGTQHATGFHGFKGIIDVFQLNTLRDKAVQIETAEQVLVHELGEVAQ